MKKDQFGIWDITIPAKSPGVCAIPHDSKLKVCIRIFSKISVDFMSNIAPDLHDSTLWRAYRTPASMDQTRYPGPLQSRPFTMLGSGIHRLPKHIPSKISVRLNLRACGSTRHMWVSRLQKCVSGRTKSLLQIFCRGSRSWVIIPYSLWPLWSMHTMLVGEPLDYYAHAFRLDTLLSSFRISGYELLRCKFSLRHSPKS
jgi:hypothetical protein